MNLIHFRTLLLRRISTTLLRSWTSDSTATINPVLLKKYQPKMVSDGFLQMKLFCTDEPFGHGMDEVIDVRSPLEYQDDHIPGAINLPVLSNEERHSIGKEYNQNSFEARRRGAALISKNIHNIITEHFMDKPKSHSCLVYCWRGGQRSKSLALVLSMIGYDVKYLVGGYKNYRTHLLSRLSHLASDFSYKVICGMTGTGKTLFLKTLEDMGEQVLDFEALANHKGSVLGVNYGNKLQPSTRWFETCLFEKLSTFDKSLPVWVEAEGRRIGRIQIPNSVFESISSNAIAAYALQATTEERIKYIMNDYKFLTQNVDVLKQELSKLTKFSLPLKSWFELIDCGKLTEFVKEILDNHYDPLYRKSQSKNLGKSISSSDRIVIDLNSVDDESIARHAHQLVLLSMASKPSYYYKLNIYEAEPEKTAHEPVDPGPRGWYFPIGLGKYVVSFFGSTKAVGRDLTTKSNNFLEYTSSLEGTLKIGCIVSSTCVGGILSLLIKPKSRIQKLFYPSFFLAASSAICYPSSAYIVSKTGIIYTYHGGETIYHGAKSVADKLSSWNMARKTQRSEQMNEDTRLEKYVVEKDVEKVLDSGIGDENTNGSWNNLGQTDGSIGDEAGSSSVDPQRPSDINSFEKGVESAGESSEATSAVVVNSVQDMGQSSIEDKELYTTRL